VPSNPIAEAHHTLVEAVARAQGKPTTTGYPEALGLHLTHICCEDSVRQIGAARGSEIRDMTLQVHSRRQGQDFATSLPVLRAPDFADRIVHLPLAAIRVRVGNHCGEPLRTIGLHEYLGDLRAHLTRPDSWAGVGSSLLSTRDHHVEVRAQACYLPAPNQGLVAFTPVACPRSWPGAPAVLAIVAAPDGTSATVVDNRRDRTRVSRRDGQYLLHNRDGQRLAFTVDARPAQGTGVIVLIQVPLLQPPPPPDRFANWDAIPMEPETGVHVEKPFVIDPRALHGPYDEIDGLAIHRDEHQPILATVQFYRTICDPVPTEDEIIELGAWIERVYADADVVGSLIDVALP
jgi:hypothetical protein